MAKRNGDGRVADLTTRILQRIQQDVASIRKQTEAVPQMGRDIAELASNFGKIFKRLDDHEARLRKVEKNLGLN
jgi:hypothetical protein